jgi:hypothetical protein
MTNAKQNTTSPKIQWTFPQIQWVVASVGLAIIVVGLLYKVMTGPAATNPVDVFAICIIGILFALSSNFDNIKSISFDKGNLKVELDRLQEKVSQNEKAIADLILMSMGPATYINLKSLANGTLREYKKPRHQGLETELYYLRNLGYIKLKEGTANSIFEIPEVGSDLLEYIEVTATGRSYIKLREERARE